MPTPICNVLSMTGIRRTSSSESYNVIVEAYHPIALGDIDRVEFAISSNGGGSSTTTVTSRAMWKPDDTTYDDPLPGSWGGGPTYIWAYGVKIQMADYAAGYIDVIPTVYAGSGESKVLSTVRIYNDKDGTDRRPSPKVIYWDYIGGNDSNSGLSSGLAKKSFEKAAEAAATSSDCGGAIIYIDAAGEHQVRGSNYGQNGNLYTSGHHWLHVLPRAGLNREDVKLVRIPEASDIDSNWMYFKGTTTTPGLQSARIRFSNLTVINSGFKIGTWTHLYMSLWIDYCMNHPPSPYGEPVLGTGLHIRSIETTAGCVDLVNKKDGIDKIFVTGSTRRCTFSNGQWGDIVRGCLIDKVAGQIFQPQYKDSALTNILAKDLYQEIGVSGRFVANGTFRIESQGGSKFRVQANSGYVGRDFIPDLAYISGSTVLGIRLENFTNSLNNNMALALLSGGYSGGLPWVDVDASGSHHNLVPESDSSAIVTNGNLRGSNTGTNYNTWGPHSDILQFIQTESYPVQNISVSNFAVFPCWESQGIFGSTSNLSGIAFVNYYDGGIGEGPRSYYFIPSSNITKNILIRNSFISRLEVSSTDQINDSEMLDNCFGQLTASEGTISSYTGQVDVRYNHFTGASLIGGNASSGLYFVSSTPAQSTNATVSALSTAYGTASSTWSRPSAWFSGNKGPWANVALADWSYTESTGGGGSTGAVTGGINFSLASVPSQAVNIGIAEDISSSLAISPISSQAVATTSSSSSLAVSPFVSLQSSYQFLEPVRGETDSPQVSENLTVYVSTSSSTATALAPDTEGGVFAVFPDTIVGNSKSPTVTPVVTTSSSTLVNSSQLFDTYQITTILPDYTTITLVTQEVENISQYITLPIEDAATITFGSVLPNISTVPPTIVVVSDTSTITFDSISATVITTTVPIITPVVTTVEIPSYLVPQEESVVTLEQLSSVVDNEVLPILLELNQVRNDLSRLPTDTRAVWSQTILEPPSPQSSKSVVKIMTTNYHKFTSSNNNPASRSTTNRSRF